MKPGQVKEEGMINIGPQREREANLEGRVAGRQL